MDGWAYAPYAKCMSICVWMHWYACMDVFEWVHRCMYACGDMDVWVACMQGVCMDVLVHVCMHAWHGRRDTVKRLESRSLLAKSPSQEESCGQESRSLSKHRFYGKFYGGRKTNLNYRKQKQQAEAEEIEVPRRANRSPIDRIALCFP
jgi:hypothetical protein